MRNTLVLLGLFIFLVSSPHRALSDDCVIRKSSDILACALKRHPEIQNAQAVDERDQSLTLLARERTNPEIETKWMTGNEAGGRTIASETTLLHKMEVGGKRRARLNQAAAQGLMSSADLQASREKIAIHVSLAAHRLRQIKTEKHLIGEDRQTFNRILSHYRQRKLLSPEQQVSLAVFDSSKQELLLSEAALIEEERSLKNEIIVATAIPSRVWEKYLPGPKRKWPSFRDEEKKQGESSLEQEAAAELSLARANVKLAQSNSWPDLRLGPTVETERFGGNTQVKAGATFEIPLPLLSRNKGERTYARLEEKRASVYYDAVLKKSASERSLQIARYRNALKSWRASVASAQSHKSHREVDELFERGLVPSSLMMEVHRQNRSLTELRHAQELMALESYWKILIMDGRLEEGTL